MRILLDTQCWLWMAGLPGQFSSEARQLLERSSNRVYLSAASSWEIAIKYGLGKLRLPEPPARYIPSRMEALKVLSLPIEHTHAAQLASLPAHHRDPFDRLLVAQAQLEDLTLLTSDVIFSRYQVEVIRA